MLEEGIVDPTKVTRSALQHAASVAAMFLTTEAVVATIPEPDNNDNPGMGGMPGMMKRPINTVISTFEMFNGHNLVVEILK